MISYPHPSLECRHLIRQIQISVTYSIKFYQMMNKHSIT